MFPEAAVLLPSKDFSVAGSTAAVSGSVSWVVVVCISVTETSVVGLPIREEFSSLASAFLFSQVICLTLDFF